jgi:uncharacterized protein (DUF1330 family)
MGEGVIHEEGVIAAYMIIVARVHDRPAMLDYAKVTAALVERLGGRYILRTRGAELLEGEFGDGDGVLIIEWADKMTARAFWDSPAYAELKALRAGKAEVQVLLVEGEFRP